MTREEARKAAEVMIAYAEGKDIEFREIGETHWECVGKFDVDDMGFEFKNFEYRIKKEPTYRPFKDKEERLADWVDNHPINVWHDVNEEPKIGSNIVAIDTDGQWWDIQPYDGDYDGNGLKGWRSCIRTYNIQKWAYIADLLPKN